MTALLEPERLATQPGNYFISNYPPYSCWKQEHIRYFFRALSDAPRETALALYVHLPFCRQRCRYCYFRVYPQRPSEDVDIYLEALLAELALYLKQPALQGRRFTTVYFGGGSPSYLSPAQLERFLGGLQAASSWDQVEECTFECDPGSTDLEKLCVLRQNGITRLSLGFQSLEDAILRRNGRNVTARQCLSAFTQARSAGFQEINIDLLAGLEGETDATWRRTVGQVLNLQPDCATIYQLELTYNSGLYAAIRAGGTPALPDWKTKRRWVQEAFQQFEKAGYAIGSGYMAVRQPGRWRFVYTVDHFWHGGDLLALGESAFGHLQGVNYQNVDRFEDYLLSIEQSRFPISRALQLTWEEKWRRELILLLKTGALDPSYFRRKFGIDLTEAFAAQFEQLLRAGWLEPLGNPIRLTREGLLQVDRLLPLFFLPQHRGVRYT